MKSIDSELKQLNIGLLQLQRSALIDTQTIMQILVDCGICTADDIVQTRKRIEETSPEVDRINSEIVNKGGVVTETPLTENQKQVQEQMEILKGLLNELVQTSQPLDNIS